MVLQACWSFSLQKGYWLVMIRLAKNKSDGNVSRMIGQNLDLKSRHSSCFARLRVISSQNNKVGFLSRVSVVCFDGHLKPSETDDGFKAGRIKQKTWNAHASCVCAFVGQQLMYATGNRNRCIKWIISKHQLYPHLKVVDCEADPQLLGLQNHGGWK